MKGAENQGMDFKFNSSMYLPCDIRQAPQSIWMKYFYLSDGNISTCVVFVVKNQ